MRSNQEWLIALKNTGKEQELAIVELKTILDKALRPALQGWARTKGREFQELADDFVQETLLLILKKIDSFNGLSRFTTWCYKILIRIALTELRKKRWQDVSLDEMEENGLILAANKVGDTTGLIEKSSLVWLMQIMQEELSAKQNRAFMAIAIQAMPLEEVARRLETNRNALYKLLHDARLKLRKRLESEGLSAFGIIG